MRCRLPLLTSAVAVCRECDVEALPHVVESVSAFLDHSHPPRWCVPSACELGSLRLAQRVLVRQPLSQHEFIDRHYKAFLFRRALIGAVVNDNLALVQWLCTEYCPWGFASLGVEKAIELGRLETVQWLAANHENILWNPQFVDQADSKCADLAAANGHLEVLQWLDAFPDSGGCTVNTMSAAALHGHFEVVKWLHSKGQKSISALRSAIQGGHLEIAKFLFENGYDTRHTRGDNGLDDAARSGHLEAVQWLHGTAISGCTRNAMDWAAGNGDLHIVQWLHENRSEGCTVYAMDAAALNGHLEVVQWLHANRTEGCSYNAMDNAAKGGHLEVVQWLHDHRSEGCSKAAIDQAATNGHLEVAQWFFANRDEACTEKAMSGAILNGHLDVVQWLHENCGGFANPVTPFWLRLKASDVGDLAAHGGHLHVIKWLHENRFEVFSEDAMVNAARRNHLDVLQWLHENRTEGSSPDAMDEAGSREVLQWLHENRHEGCTASAMDNAVLRSDFESVLYLHEHVSDGCSPKVSRSIRNFGDHLELWLWLYAHYRDRLDIYDIHWRFYERDDLRTLLKKLGL